MASVKPDPTLRAALDLAREAAESIAESGTVGDHLGMEMVEDRLATHYFTCTAAAYPGWRWAITVARVPRSKTVTVCETNLVPGDGALLSPQWLPYADRLAPGDVGPGDVTPKIDDDPLLEAGFEATGDEDVDQMAQWELGLGRPRVLSAPWPKWSGMDGVKSGDNISCPNLRLNPTVCNYRKKFPTILTTMPHQNVKQV